MIWPVQQSKNDNAGIAIHRHALKRVDDAWQKTTLANPDSRFIVSFRGKYPVTSDNHIRLLTRDEAESLASNKPDFYFLAEIESTDYQCHVFCAQLEIEPNDIANWQTLRYTNNDDELTKLALHAQGLLNWHAVCCFCETCGNNLKTAIDGHSKTCVAPDCRREIFPRITPAVIVLVTFEDKCLLANAHHFKGDIPMYSCLAGYMETGESFEETLQREVMEEVGVELLDCEYLGNQPWPFPHSLMIGFHARAKATDLTFHDGEIKAARWFTATDLQAALKAREILLPTRKSIAYHLLDVWLQHTASVSLESLLETISP